MTRERQAALPREDQLRAAATAIGLILDEIGPHASLILVNATLDAIVDRLKAAKSPP